MTALKKREEKKKIFLDECVGEGGETERVKKKTLDDCDNWTHWKLIRKPLGMSWT
jgi:hypothetical protein